MTGAGVAALRHSMGLSQAQLGRMLGVHERSIRSWESGRNVPSAGSVDKLWALVKRHVQVSALMAQLGTIEVDRVVSPLDSPPQSWYLAAAGRLLVSDPSRRVEWI